MSWYLQFFHLGASRAIEEKDPEKNIHEEMQRIASQIAGREVEPRKPALTREMSALKGKDLPRSGTPDDT